jgi:galactitol-specific phosphotransferase system IIB component
MSGEEKAEVKPQSGLVKQAARYFQEKGYKVEQENTTIEGFSGISRKFDLIVQKAKLIQGVWVRDWQRTIGVNIIINLDRASEDVGLTSPIMVGEKFSEHVKSYANRRKITLLTRRQLSLSPR